MVNKYFAGNVPKYNGQLNEVDKEFEEYTIKQMNLEPLPLETMLSFIGPPIKVSIKKVLLIKIELL